MIRYRKLSDLSRSMSSLVTEHDLVSALFEDMPELQEFTYSVTQEYDDNNYYANTRLTSVNGWPVEDEEEEDPRLAEDDEDFTPSGPKISDVSWIENLVGEINEDDASDNEEITVRRENYVKKQKGSVHHKYIVAERKYFTAHLAGRKLPDSFFIKNEPKLALYHALDHGRFKPETEFKVFAKRGRMSEALEYARHIIKGRLPSEVENFFILDASEEDQRTLQKYSAEFLDSEAKSA